MKKTLVLQVFDWDLITGDDDIGEVRRRTKYFKLTTIKEI